MNRIALYSILLVGLMALIPISFPLGFIAASKWDEYKNTHKTSKIQGGTPQGTGNVGNVGWKELKSIEPEWFTNTIILHSNKNSNLDIGYPYRPFRMPGDIRSLNWETKVGTNLFQGEFRVEYTSPSNIIGVIVWRGETNQIYLRHH